MKYLKKFNESLSGNWKGDLDNPHKLVPNVSEINDALKYGDFNYIDKIIKEYDIDFRNGYLLRNCVRYKNLDMFKYLLKNGANPHTNHDFSIKTAFSVDAKDIVDYFMQNDMIDKNLAQDILNGPIGIKQLDVNSENYDYYISLLSNL